MSSPAVKFLGTPGPPFHLKMISTAPFHPHALKPLKPHPGFTASLEERLLGCKKFGEFLQRKTLEGTALRKIQKTFADITSMAGKKPLHAIAGHQIDTHAAQRGGASLEPFLAVGRTSP